MACKRELLAGSGSHQWSPVDSPSHPSPGVSPFGPDEQRTLGSSAHAGVQIDTLLKSRGEEGV